MTDQMFRIAAEEDLEEGIAKALSEIDAASLDDLVIQAHGQDEHQQMFRQMLADFASSHSRRLLEDEAKGIFYFLPLRLQ